MICPGVFVRRSAYLILLPLLTGAAPGALIAQEVDQRTAPPQDDADEGDEIIVTGQPERGAVIGDIEPEQKLSSADVRALGDR